jgi:hypothetical protein
VYGAPPAPVVVAGRPLVLILLLVLGLAGAVALVVWALR